MKKGLLLVGIIVSSALFSSISSAAQPDENVWTLKQTVDEFGDATGETVFSYKVDGDFSNTATNSSSLKVVSAFYPDASAFGFNLFEYGNTLATYYDSSQLTFKFKINDAIYEFKMVGSAPNGMVFLSDDLLKRNDINAALNDSSVSVEQRWKSAQALEKSDIPFEESGAKQLFHYLYNGNDLKCIIYIDNSKYDFSITANGFKELYDEYVYNTGISFFNNNDYQNAASCFSYLGDYKDSISYYEKCIKTIQDNLLSTLGLKEIDIDILKKMVEIFGAIYNGEELDEDRVQYVHDHINDLPMVNDDTVFTHIDGDDKPALFPPINVSGHEFFSYPIDASYEYTRICYSIDGWHHDEQEFYTCKTTYRTVNGETDKYNDGLNWEIESSDGNLLWKTYHFYYTLKNGSSGEAVQHLQQALISQGFLSGSADGVYGSGTASAVASFQQSKGLEETGIADQATQKALFNEDGVVVYKDRLFKLYDGFYFVEHEEVETGSIEYKLYGFKKVFGHLASYDDVVANLGIVFG